MKSKPINLAKLKADLRKEMELSVRKAMASVPASDLIEIGDTVITEMKKNIAKGVSPIKERGRFDAYKWAGKANQLMKVLKSSKSKSEKGQALRRDLKNKVKKMKSNKYPYSVQDKFPSKRERPVNLFLSGWFLSQLLTKVGVTQKIGRQILVGFEDEKAIKYEQGHRDGANGQPVRPIIPASNESFNPSIFNVIQRKALEVFRRRLVGK